MSILKENGFYLISELGEGIENLYLPLITKLKGGELRFDSKGSKG
jgi:hypothetical protein